MQAKRWLSHLRAWPKRSRSTIVLWTGAILVGLIAVVLAKSASYSFAWFDSMTNRWHWWPFVSLPAGGLAIAWLMKQVGPGAEGSGIPQAVAALEVTAHPSLAQRLLSTKLAITKFVCIIVGLGSGFVLGREGPTVQIGASVLYSLRRFVPKDSPSFRRHLILAGGAAGIAAAFNTPLAGIIFAFEELARSIEEYTSGKLIGVVILGGVVSLAFLGNYTYFGHIKAPGFHYSIILPLIIIAILAGLTGGLFSWLCVTTRRWLPKPIENLRANRPYVFVILCGLLIALCGMFAPIFGSGAEITDKVISGHMHLAWYYLPLKFIGLTATYLTGVPGGIFAPSLSVGAGIGNLFLPLFDPSLHAKLIAIGMVGTLAAVTRAPLTSAFIVIEMTDGHSMVISALASAMIAANVARVFKTNFYHDLANRALQKFADDGLISKEELGKKH